MPKMPSSTSPQNGEVVKSIRDLISGMYARVEKNDPDSPDLRDRDFLERFADAQARLGERPAYRDSAVHGTFHRVGRRRALARTSCGDHICLTEGTIFLGTGTRMRLA